MLVSGLAARIFAGIDKQDLQGQSLYAIFERVYNRKFHWSEGATVAGEGEEEVAELQAAVGSALLVIRETTYDMQRVAIEYSLSFLRGDRYTASVISIRKN